jgi:hypothetical protein
MKMATYLLTFFIGITLGVLAVGIGASRAYDRGRRDERDDLPTDISEYIKDSKPRNSAQTK